MSDKSDSDNMNVSGKPVDITATAAKRIDQVNDWLYVGGALPPEEYQRLVALGIRRIVDLREQVPDDSGALDAVGIERHHAPVINHRAPTDAQLEEVARSIAAMGEDRPVYVHCAGGFGRATTMAIGLLVKHGTSLDEAIEQVRNARPETLLNDEQIAWLRALEAQSRR